jgi:ABC-2 type transport system ATP-binding protein
LIVNGSHVNIIFLGKIFMLQINNLNYQYPKTKDNAIYNINLMIESGNIYVLMGENGSGKTTTLKLITGLLLAQPNTIFLNGQDAVLKSLEVKQEIAFMPDWNIIYDNLTVYEYIELFANLWKIKNYSENIDYYLDFFDLKEKAHVFCKNLSQGMKQKTMFIASIIHKPKLLIMDEPFTGLDIAASKKIKLFLKEYVSKGNAVLITTHILPFAESVADYIGFLKQGHLVFEKHISEIDENLEQYLIENFYDI